jgi:mannose-6-phosphate isomerase-like protein (cupin superfamily)
MLPVPLSRENAPHYVWGDNCDGWRLLQESNLSVIEERMPPDASEVRHFHTNAQQFFFILSGQAVMETNSERILLLAGQGVAIPPRTRHQFRNHSEEPVRFLVISQPSSYGYRVTEWRRKNHTLEST